MLSLLSPSRIAAMALAGLVGTVLVAWGCQLFCRTSAIDLAAAPDPRANRPADVRAFTPWISASRWMLGGGLGRTNIWYIGTSDGDVVVSQSGWPMRALEMVRREPPLIALGRTPGAAVPSTQEWAWITPRDHMPRSLTEKPLPLRPLWVGFFVDTALWGLAWWPVLYGARWLRGRAWAWKGRCAGCGYPVGVSDRCTECGRRVASGRWEGPGPTPAAKTLDSDTLIA